MMNLNKIGILITGAVMVMTLNSCIVYKGYHQWGYEPKVGQLRHAHYEVLGQAEAKVSNFALLWLVNVTENPDYDRAIREMISEKGGDDVINVSFWIEKQHWLLGTVNIMHIRGTVIRYIQE